MYKAAILQSNYIPWKGYFDLIDKVDLFIFGDAVQYTHFDWRNRNRIKTPNGLQWLTVPVGSNIDRRIFEVEIKDGSWQKKHWNMIKANYSKAPYFKQYSAFFEEIYLHGSWTNLSSLNQTLIRRISKELLGSKTEFIDSREINGYGGKQDGIMEMLRTVGADYYLSGPLARNYISEEEFAKRNIELAYIDYGRYPEYPQFYPPFTHQVTILDLLFQVGPSAPSYIWGDGGFAKGGEDVDNGCDSAIELHPLERVF